MYASLRMLGPRLLWDMIPRGASFLPLRLHYTKVFPVSNSTHAVAGCRHTDWVTAVHFHPTDNTQLLSTSVDGKV